MPVVTTRTEREAREASRLLTNLADVPDGRVSVRRLRTLEHEQRQASLACGQGSELPSKITIVQADFRSFDWTAWEGRASLVLADPPWGQWDQHEDLAATIVKVLRLVLLLLPNGLLVKKAFSR